MYRGEFHHVLIGLQWKQDVDEIQGLRHQVTGTPPGKVLILHLRGEQISIISRITSRLTDGMAMMISSILYLAANIGIIFTIT